MGRYHYHLKNLSLSECFYNKTVLARRSKRIASLGMDMSLNKSNLRKQKSQGQLNSQQNVLRRSTRIPQNSNMPDKSSRSQFFHPVHNEKRSSERISSLNMEKTATKKENCSVLPKQRHLTDSKRSAKQKPGQKNSQNSHQLTVNRPARIQNRRSTIAIPEEVPLEMQLRNLIHEEQEKNISLTNDYINVQKKLLEVSGKYNALKEHIDQIKQKNTKLTEENQRLKNAAKSYFVNIIRGEHNYV